MTSSSQQLRHNQAANRLMMIEPCFFGFNHETSKDNLFQKQLSESSISIQTRCKTEFFNMIDLLRQHDIHVVHTQNLDPRAVDAVFPNNWIQMTDGSMILYPMKAQNRQLERSKEVLQTLALLHPHQNILDYTPYEKQGYFLEGTGSMIFDYMHRHFYASLSERTHPLLLDKLAQDTHFTYTYFSSFDQDARPIYHTNVMLSIATHFAIVCLDAVQEDQRLRLDQALRSTKRDIFTITHPELNSFCGNCLEVLNSKKESFLLMSKTAYLAFSKKTLTQISKLTHILPIDIPTIETIGGGSVRCMLLEMDISSQILS